MLIIAKMKNVEELVRYLEQMELKELRGMYTAFVHRGDNQSWEISVRVTTSNMLLTTTASADEMKTLKKELGDFVFEGSITVMMEGFEYAVQR